MQIVRELLGTKPWVLIGLSRSTPDREILPLLKRHVHQQLVAFDVDDVAEGPLPTAGEVESNAAAAYAHVAYAEVFQKIGQRRIHNIQFSSGGAGPDAEHGQQHEKYRARRPCLRRTGNRILHRLIVLAPLNTAEELRQAVITEVERSLK